MGERIKSFGTRLIPALSTRPFNVFGNTASILGLVLLVANDVRWDLEFIPLAYLCALSLYLLVRYMRQERWARYSEAVLVIDRANRLAKNATDRLLYGSANNEAFFEVLQGSLTAFAEAFTLVTGTACRATIKEVYVDQALPPPDRRGRDAAAVDVLLAATVLRAAVDPARPVHQEASVRVDANSDFEEVFRDATPFFSNDLPALWMKGQYRNSHWGDELRQSKKFPYRSAIVWPIAADPPPGSERPADDEPAVRAFLCVDSARRHAFIQRADVAFGGVYAHALYPGLRYALVGARVGGPRA